MKSGYRGYAKACNDNGLKDAAIGAGVGALTGSAAAGVGAVPGTVAGANAGYVSGCLQGVAVKAARARFGRTASEYLNLVLDARHRYKDFDDVFSSNLQR